MHPHRVPANSKKDGLSQAENARIPPEHAESHGHDGQREVFAEQVKVEIGHPERRVVRQSVQQR